MKTLKILEHISLDGIIQHTTDENGFPYGDWMSPYRSAEGGAAIVAAQGEEYDLLLGRRTYDMWAGYWPTAASGPIADRFNAATKYVVTHRSEGLAWGPSVAVGPDVAEGVRRIKEQPGPNLILWGSASLTSTLLAHGLVDEVFLCVYPVLLGTGKRFFAEGTPACSLELVETRSTSTGVVFNSYKAVRLLG